MLKNLFNSPSSEILKNFDKISRLRKQGSELELDVEISDSPVHVIDTILCHRNIINVLDNNFLFVFRKKTFFSFLLAYMYHEIIRKKWRRLYYNFCKKIIIVDEGLSFSDLRLSIYLHRQIKKTESLEIVNDFFKDQEIGQLIRDTYARYRSNLKFDYSDPYIIFLLFKILRIRGNLTKNTYSQKLLQTYTCYLSHGLITNFFLSNDLKVYVQPFPGETEWEIKSEYPYHTQDLKLENSFYINIEESLAIEEFLTARFESNNINLYGYLKNFKEKTTPKKKFDTAIFLHDFDDAFNIYGKSIFHSFFEWLEFTLDKIGNHSRTAIKRHPFSIGKDSRLINYIRHKYPELSIIEAEVNTLDFIRNIDVGISHYGTVLFELSYLEKVAICSSYNPTSEFKLCYTPSSRDEYEDLLKNRLYLKPKKRTYLNQYVLKNFLNRPKPKMNSIFKRESLWKENDEIINHLKQAQ